MDDKVKEIQLEQGDVIAVYDKNGAQKDTYGYEPVVFIPPKRKTVKLSELPDGTIVKADIFYCYVSDGELYSLQHANGEYSAIQKEYKTFPLEIIKSPKQVWEGGPCPVPDGVVVRVGFRKHTLATDGGLGIHYEWSHDGTSCDIIWYQILRLADGWELVK